MRIFLIISFVICSIFSAVAAPVCDGVTDDTAAILAAGQSGTPLPAGNCRVTADILQVATAPGDGTPGLRLIGQGMYATTILADYNGDIVKGGVIHFDQAAPSQFTDGTVIRDLAITQVAGRTGLNGISLTAAKYVTIERVNIQHMSGTGIKVPWRSDINPTLSDPYQCLAISIIKSEISNNAVTGIDFGGGQSPGLYEILYSHVTANAGYGIRVTTGQGRIIGNDIRINNSGGVFLDTVEGPSMVGEIYQNEIDTNFPWNMNLRRVRDWDISRNRFLGRMVGSVMTPLVHVNLGGGPSIEVYNVKFEQNYFRTVAGPGTTTAATYAFDASTGSLSASFPIQILHSDFGPFPFDGVIQNSTGMVKFVGSMPGAVIVDP